MNYYIATSLANCARAQRLRDLLTTLGHQLTFDWTEAAPLDPQDPRCKEGEEEIEEASRDDLSHRGFEELAGVASADCLIVILPGGIGTHVELGAALGRNLQIRRIPNKRRLASGDRETKIFIWAEGGLQNHQGSDAYPCVFHFLADAQIETEEGDLADMVARVEAWAKSWPVMIAERAV